jgi:hypothetical protein
MTTPPPHKEPARALLSWIPAALWAGVIFAGSSIPGSSIPGRFSVVGHLFEYSVLGALVMFAERRKGWRTAALVAVLVCAAYGASDEFHQAFVPLRTPDPIDWLTDVAGASAGILAYASASGFRTRVRTRHSEPGPPDAPSQ